MAEHIYSNPISVYNGLDKVGYTYQPKGIIPFCVRMEKHSWIPVSVMVFSDSPKNAIKEVVKALEWQESQRSDNQRAEIALQEFLATATQRVEEVTPNQLFKIGWASNDNICIS